MNLRLIANFTSITCNLAMKKRILLSLLDIVTGLFIGFAGYEIIKHNANAVDWCIIAFCLAIMVIRLCIIIKTANRK